MADIQKKLNDAKVNMYNTNALFTDIANQLNKIASFRTNNLATIKSLRQCETKGLTIDSATMEATLKTEAELFQAEANTMAKLKEIHSITNALKARLHHSVDCHAHCSELKELIVRRKVVTLK